jgi:hypothetical protein
MATPRYPAVARRDPATARVRRPAAATVPVLGLCLLLGACSSSGSGSAATSPAAVRATCTQVSAVLSDGPDPAADPVGYAEAQILPLQQIRTPDAQLKTAIGRLADAYRAFFDSGGSSGAAKLAVTVASKRIDSFCPGAAT